MALPLRRLPLGLLAVLTLHPPRAALGVLVGADLGSQYFKASIVSPGKPFDVVLNKESKRKTPTVVSFHDKARTFGDDGVKSSSRGLAKTPMFFMHQLGRNLSEKPSEGHQWLPTRFYPYKLGANISGSLLFQFDEDGDGVTAEEAAAHVLRFLKRMSEENVDGNIVTELVLTVSSQATQRQRRALLDAAEMARYSSAHLIHETSAAAVQRAPDLILGTNGTANTSTVLYYNVGSRHVEACIVVYRGATHMSKPTAALDVLGCGHSSEFGGHHVDMLIADKMREAFNEKHPKLAEGLDASVRALKKLEKEANSLKHVLSANKEAQFRVEALHEDTDFVKPVSRETLETWCEPLFKAALVPIEAALDEANITLEDVDAVEMIGGGWRMPKVQTMLSEYLQSRRSSTAPVLQLSQHLNGEEAMATGAAFYGANSSVSFRTKKIFFTDIMPHSYALLFSPLNVSQLNDTQREEGWTRGVELFPALAKLRARKTVKLHISFDISMTLIENGNKVGTWELSGIHEASTVTYTELGTPLVSLKLELDGSGVVQLTSAQAIFDEPYNHTVTVALGNTTEKSNASSESNDSNATESGGSSKTEETPAEPAAAEELTPEDKAKLETLEKQKQEAIDAEDFDKAAEIKEEIAALKKAPEANASQAVNATKLADETVKTTTKNVTKIRKRKVNLAALEQYEGIVPRPLSPEEKAWAMKRMDDADEFDAEVQRKQAVSNALEAFIYDSREKLTSDELCMKVSTEEERETIVSALTAAEDWFYEDEAVNGNASVFEGKLQELTDQVNPIKFRAFELEQRPSLPELVEAVSQYLNQTLTYVKTNMTWVSAKEIEGVMNLSAQFGEWYANVTTAQAAKAETEIPTYTVRDVKVRLEKMRSEALRLTKIRKIDPVPYSDYGRGYGGSGGYGGYDDARMKDFYRSMYENMSRNGSNGTNFSDFWRNFNYSDFGGGNDSDYMKSFYEHAAKNFSEGQAKDNTTGAGQEKAEGDKEEL